MDVQDGRAARKGSDELKSNDRKAGSSTVAENLPYDPSSSFQSRIYIPEPKRPDQEVPREGMAFDPISMEDSLTSPKTKGQEEMLGGWENSAKILMWHFHTICHGTVPLEVDWSEEVRNEAEADEQSLAFVKKLKDLVKSRGKLHADHQTHSS